MKRGGAYGSEEVKKWEVDDIACAMLANENRLYRLVKVGHVSEERYRCLSLLNNKTYMNYKAHELKRVIISFVGPVVLEHEGEDPAVFVWFKK